jgi:hypothetical protein
VFYQPESGEVSTHKYYVRRRLLMYLEEEELWARDKIIMPSTWKKHQIWEDLKMRMDMPDLSQFGISHQDLYITELGAWPAGTLAIRLQVFAIKWEVENPKSLAGHAHISFRQ